jgi:GNAT superfamily N-acetyltransferase
MELSATPVALEAILPWRDCYRLEMACQVIHDSLHDRPGWTQEYLLRAGGIAVGYGSVATAGPWAGNPAVYEFFVAPQHRLHVFELFRTLLEVSGAAAIEVQSNDPLAAVMVHTFARDVTSESILFRDGLTTFHRLPGALFREAVSADLPDVPSKQLRWHGVVEVDGAVAASGGILFHYNPPYGDIYMEVAEAYRRRGLGAYVVQELKRVCYEGGHVPGARCKPSNIASRRALQKAGFVPCGHILSGSVHQAREDQ